MPTQTPLQAIEALPIPAERREQFLALARTLEPADQMKLLKQLSEMLMSHEELVLTENDNAVGDFEKFLNDAQKAMEQQQRDTDLSGAAGQLDQSSSIS